MLPLVVLTELEGEAPPSRAGLGRPPVRCASSRTCAPATDRSSSRMPVNDEGGTLRVELNHQDSPALPPPLTRRRQRPPHPRRRAQPRPRGPRRRRRHQGPPAAAEGERRRPRGRRVPQRARHRLRLDRLRRARGLELGDRRAVRPAASSTSPRPRELPCHTGVALHAGSQSALARVHADKRLHLVRPDQAMFDAARPLGRAAHRDRHPRSTSQVGIVSLGGSAGTGKSVLALAAGLEAVLERRTHQRVVVFRPIYAVGGQDLGYLPGVRDREDGAVGAPRSPTRWSRWSAARSSTR